MRITLHRRGRRPSSLPVIADVLVDARRFRVTVEIESPNLVVGFVHPHRPHREKKLPAARTEMRFKLHVTDRLSWGYVTNIEVVPSKQRQGWATSLVRVLLDLYPDCVWTVESPNQRSGQLFVELAKRHPGQILPPFVDEDRPVTDRRRYSTRTF